MVSHDGNSRIASQNMSGHVTFQDPLFSSARVVQRTLESGTVLQLTPEPLSGECVRVLAYRRKRVGERWVNVAKEVGRQVAWRQLGLELSFGDVFG